MAKRAFSHMPLVEVSDWEISQGGKSYTAVTLEHLAQYGQRISFLCGTDMLLTLEEWYRPERIFELADIVCMPREEECSRETLEEKAACYRKKFGATVRILEEEPRVLSSTEVRRCLAGRGCELSSMLAPSVLAYIEEKGLYRE